MFTSRIQITDQDVRTTSSTKSSVALGQLGETSDGRVWAYALAGASNLSAGLITQTPAVVTNHVNATGVATVANDLQVAYTLGATVATVDQYADGYLNVNDGAGVNVYRIVGNTAATVAGSYGITVKLAEPVTVATTTSSKFSLFPNPYAKTVVSDYTAAPAIPVNGVPNIAVTATNYYWTQVGGYAAVLSDGAITKNAGAIASNAVNGAVEIEVAGTVTKRVGYAPELTVDTKYYPIVLTIVQ